MTKGTGRRLLNAVREQCETGLAQLKQHIADRKILPEASESKQKPVLHDNIRMDGRTVPNHATMTSNNNFHSTNGYSTYAGIGHASSFGRAADLVSSTSNGNSVDICPAMAGYNYPEPSGAQFPLPTAHTTTYAGSPYPIALAAQALSSNYHSNIHNRISNPVSGGYTPAISTYTDSNSHCADSQSWFQYTQKIPSNVGPQDYHPASALLQLGGRTDQNATMIGSDGDVALSYDTSGMSGGAGQMWPFGVVDHGRGGS